jgi:cell division protein FtsB
MAKALIGYLDSDQRLPARLSAENARLRLRVAELEQLVSRLAQENDVLAAESARALDLESKTMQEMQPA